MPIIKRNTDANVDSTDNVISMNPHQRCFKPKSKTGMI